MENVKKNKCPCCEGSTLGKKLKRCNFCDAHVLDNCLIKKGLTCKKCIIHALRIHDLRHEERIIDEIKKFFNDNLHENATSKLSALEMRKQTPAKRSLMIKATNLKPNLITNFTTKKEKGTGNHDKINIENREDLKKTNESIGVNSSVKESKSCLDGKTPPGRQSNSNGNFLDIKSVLEKLGAPYKLVNDTPSDGDCGLHTMIALNIDIFNIEDLREMDVFALRSYLCDNEERLLREKGCFELFYDSVPQNNREVAKQRKVGQWIGSSWWVAFSQLIKRDVIIVPPWASKVMPFERISAPTGHTFLSKPQCLVAYPNGCHYRPMMPTWDDNIVREYLHSSLEFMGVNLSAEIQGAPGEDPWREGIHEPPQLGRIRDLLKHRLRFRG